MSKRGEKKQSSDCLVEVRNVSFSRDSRTILKKINLNIQTHKITAILGPSGCGKTTLLRLIGGQLHPDMGSVHFAGQLISGLSRQDLYALRKKMGVLFQSAALFRELSVFDNVAFPLREHSPLPESMIRTLVLMKLEAVGLRGAVHLHPHELSGGMLRRVALARAIAMDPLLIMYDEPFAGQDPISKGIIVKLIKTLNEALNLTTILISHDIHETLSIADYIYVLGDGKVLGEGSPQNLYLDDKTTNPFVQQFLQGLPDGPLPFHYAAKRSYIEDLNGA